MSGNAETGKIHQGPLVRVIEIENTCWAGDWPSKLPRGESLKLSSCLKILQKLRDAASGAPTMFGDAAAVGSFLLL